MHRNIDKFWLLVVMRQDADFPETYQIHSYIWNNVLWEKKTKHKNWLSNFTLGKEKQVDTISL